MNANRESRQSALTRRQLLEHAAFGAAAWAAPAIVPSSVLEALAPSHRINVAEIGMGNQSQVDLPAFLRQPDAQVVAVCDVNTASHGYKTPEQFLGRKPGQDRVNGYYAKQTGVGGYKGCDAYRDFRDVLARTDVDAVVLVVPDHWHASMTIMAAKAGKDIYCEKPLSLTVRDGQAMVKAVRRYQRVLQTGSMYRSGPRTRFCCELIRNGRIGKVKRILCSVGGAPKGPGPAWKPMPVPEGFDYETWLGPAPAAPYHIDRCLYRFRYILDYSGGETTNTGAHVFGQIQWALGTDDTGPVEFEDMGTVWPELGDLYTAARKVSFRARYANGVELLCGVNIPGVQLMGTRFEGTDGWVQLAWDGLETHPESLKTTRIRLGEIHLPVSVPGREMLLAGRQQMKGSSLNLDHARDFLDCVKSRRDPVEPVEAGHRTASLCHLANIAMRLRRKIRWDPEQEQILGDDEAGQMLRDYLGTATTGPYRLVWDTSWVPDQQQPIRLAAWVVDQSGLTYFTEAVGELKLLRPGRSVELCKPYDVPKRWVTRSGEKEEKFRVAGDPAHAVAARLVWSSWSPGYMNGVYVNGKKVFDREGPRYACFAHCAPLDVSTLVCGVNVLKTCATPKYDGKTVHGMEVNWPGMMVLIQYRD